MTMCIDGMGLMTVCIERDGVDDHVHRQGWGCGTIALTEKGLMTMCIDRDGVDDHVNRRRWG